jgi:TetR/AcrR family transcriptional repressor of lmrAB and yxaGH operons
MVAAGEDLLSQRGYGVTMLDIVDKADAPRGSIYYHFPNGKTELTIAVANKLRREVEEFVAKTSARIADPTAFLQRLLDHHRKRLVTSDYDLGCPLMGVIASGEMDSDELARAVDDAFTTWIGAIAAALRTKGFTAAQANHLASLVVTGVEGSIVVARAKRSPQPFLDFSKSIPVLVAGIAQSA